MTRKHEIADIVVYLKLPSRETIKRKHTTALHKTAAEPGGEHGGQPAAGCRDSLPAIPLVFADGSLRTHRLSLVGKKTYTKIGNVIYTITLTLNLNTSGRTERIIKQKWERDLYHFIYLKPEYFAPDGTDHKLSGYPV